MKQHLKRKVKNVIVNNTQVLVVLITANRVKQKLEIINIKTEVSYIILGDSMTKHANGWEIFRKLLGNFKLYVKHLSGAKTKCMKTT